MHKLLNDIRENDVEYLLDNRYWVELIANFLERFESRVATLRK